MSDQSPFNQRAIIGSTPYGLDADYYDHAHRRPTHPDLTVADSSNVAGYLWSPDGKAYRIVARSRPSRFGFAPKKEEDEA